MSRKPKLDKQEVKEKYEELAQKAKQGRQTCPYCGSNEFWQTSTQGKQCNKCYNVF